MGAIVAGVVTLMTAFIAVVLVVGIPVLLGALLFPYLRNHLLDKLRVAERLIRAGNRSMDRDRHQGPTAVAGGGKAMPV